MLFYLLAFTSALLSLSLWFRFQENEGLNRLFRTLFFGGLAAYVVALGLAPGTWTAKWPWLLRDLGILAVVPFVLSLLRIGKTGFLLALALAAGLIGTGVRSLSLQSIEPESHEWELLVELKSDASLAALEPLINQYQLQVQPAFTMQNPELTDLDDYYALEIPQRFESSISQIVEGLERIEGIEYVEGNELVQVAPEVAPPVRRGRLQKYVNDPGVVEQWGFESMRMDRFYQFLRDQKPKPRKKALVAILDTGVDSKHEDLEPVFVSTRSKYDKDVRGHGTHCAGIAAAVSNNGKGIASFSWKKNLYDVTSIKVLSDFGAGRQRTILQGMLEAADQGADVISMSLGGRASASKQKAYEEAVRYANQKGAIVVAAAGNDGLDARQVAPANVKGVITVSAVDTLDNRASFSNSVEYLERGVAAPGVAVYSTLPDNRYQSLNGTSMAAPHVAGLIACMKSFRPELTTDEAYQLLHQTGMQTLQPRETGRLIQPAPALQSLLLTK